MPIYSYRCLKCATVFERLEGVVEEEDEKKCPNCGSKKAEKVFSSFSVGKGRSSSKSSPACQSCCDSSNCGL